MDLIVNGYDKLISEIERRVNRDYEIELKQLRNKARDSNLKAILTLKLLRDYHNPATVTLAKFLKILKQERII